MSRSSSPLSDAPPSVKDDFDTDSESYDSDDYDSDESWRRETRPKKRKRLVGKSSRPAALAPGEREVTLTPHGLPPVTTILNPKWADCFFRFCAERHSIWEKKDIQGLPREEWTKDITLATQRVGNLFRELDRGSESIRKGVIERGDQSHLEICFRIFLYCAFHSDATWNYLIDTLGEVPSWRTWSLAKYESILHQKSIIRKEKIYYGGFQNVPPTMYFSSGNTKIPHYAASLRFVQALMEMGLPAQLQQCKYAVDASSILRSIPTLGGFLSLCMLCYLNDSPHLNFAYRNFASCGPGARKFLQRIFGKSTINSVVMEEAGLIWLYENQWEYWQRIGIDPPHAWTIGLRPGMRVLDMENALCWCHRYVNWSEGKNVPNFADYPPLSEVKVEYPASMPAWCDEERYANHRGKVAVKDDYEEIKDRVDKFVWDGEERYEVEKIVCRHGNRGDRDGCFRVRWKGWMPEDDTWERASSLRKGASEALTDWLEWEQAIWGTIERIRHDYPYVDPRGFKSKNPSLIPLASSSSKCNPRLSYREQSYLSEESDYKDDLYEGTSFEETLVTPTLAPPPQAAPIFYDEDDDLEQLVSEDEPELKQPRVDLYTSQEDIKL